MRKIWSYYVDDPDDDEHDGGSGRPAQAWTTIEGAKAAAEKEALEWGTEPEGLRWNLIDGEQALYGDHGTWVVYSIELLEEGGEA